MWSGKNGLFHIRDVCGLNRMDLRINVTNVFKNNWMRAENLQMYSPTDFKSVGEFESV